MATTTIHLIFTQINHHYGSLDYNLNDSHAALLHEEVKEVYGHGYLYQKVCTPSSCTVYLLHLSRQPNLYYSHFRKCDLIRTSDTYTVIIFSHLLMTRQYRQHFLSIRHLLRLLLCQRGRASVSNAARFQKEHLRLDYQEALDTFGQHLGD